MCKDLKIASVGVGSYDHTLIRIHMVLAILIGFIAMLFWVTIAKLGGSAANPWG